jgi:hypothetical protein
MGSPAQFPVTFGQSGIEADSTGRIVKIKGKINGKRSWRWKKIAATELPTNDWRIDARELLRYQFTHAVPSTNRGQQYMLRSVTGPSNPVRVSAAVTVTGNYEAKPTLWKRVLKEPVGPGLKVAAFLLVLIALGLIAHAVWASWLLFTDPKRYLDLGQVSQAQMQGVFEAFGPGIVLIIGDVLLAVIMLELVHTILAQLDQPSGRLGVELLMNLLIIGVVAGIRHILAVSAQLTFTSATQPSAIQLAARRSLMLEIGLTAVIVILLTVGWALAHAWSRRYSPPPLVLPGETAAHGALGERPP